jgi:hypothetical protein
MKTLIVVAVVLAASSFPAIAGPTPIQIFKCGAVIPANSTGMLMDDVGCPMVCQDHPSIEGCDPGAEQPCPGAGELCVSQSIVLGRNATLRMNGFHLIGAHEVDIVICDRSDPTPGSCSIEGPGEIDCDHGTGISGGNRNVFIRGIGVRYCDACVGTTQSIFATDVALLACDSSLAAGKTIKKRHVFVAP